MTYAVGLTRFGVNAEQEISRGQLQTLLYSFHPLDNGAKGRPLGVPQTQRLHK